MVLRLDALLLFQALAFSTNNHRMRLGAPFIEIKIKTCAVLYFLPMYAATIIVLLNLATKVMMRAIRPNFFAAVAPTINAVKPYSAVLSVAEL